MFGKKEKEKEKEKERKMMMMKLYNCDTGNKRKKGKKRRSVFYGLGHRSTIREIESSG